MFLRTALFSSLETVKSLVLSMIILCLGSFGRYSPALSPVFRLETSSLSSAFLRAITYLLWASVFEGSVSIIFLKASHYLLTRSSSGSLPLWFYSMKALNALIRDSAFSRDDYCIPSQFIAIIISSLKFIWKLHGLRKVQIYIFEIMGSRNNFVVVDWFLNVLNLLKKQ